MIEGYHPSIEAWSYADCRKLATVAVPPDQTLSAAVVDGRSVTLFAMVAIAAL